MSITFKFGIYEKNSNYKRTTYRVVERDGWYVIEVYRSEEARWAEAFDAEVRFKTLTALCQSKYFMSLFTENEWED